MNRATLVLAGGVIGVVGGAVAASGGLPATILGAVLIFGAAVAQTRAVLDRPETRPVTREAEL